MPSYSGVKYGSIGNLISGNIIVSSIDQTINVTLVSGVLIVVKNTRIPNNFKTNVQVGYDLGSGEPGLFQVLAYWVPDVTSGGHLIEDEGMLFPVRSKLNFIGNGVTAEDDATNDTTKVIIPGADSGIAFPLSDGNHYVAKDGSWVLLPTPGTGIEEAPVNGIDYVRKDGGWVLLPTPSTGIEEAPANGANYVRKNGAWAAYTDVDADIDIDTGSKHELLMQDGVTHPPVPLETEDGTDWLYQG